MHTRKQLVQSLFEKFQLPVAVCVWLFWQFSMTVISFVTEAATHTTTYRRKKSSEKVSAWMVFICYFSAFFSWWWQAQLHIWSRSEYEKSVFVFFIEDLKCKCALSLTATDSLSFILFPSLGAEVYYVSCQILWPHFGIKALLPPKYLYNRHTPANRLWRSNA